LVFKEGIGWRNVNRASGGSVNVKILSLPVLTSVAGVFSGIWKDTSYEMQ
jgi:hypothetical protein